MKRALKIYYYIISFLIIFIIIGCSNYNNRADKLEQVRICLEAKDVTSKLFNQRNIPLSKLLAEAKTDKYGIDKSGFVTIDSLTADLSRKINYYKQLIQSKSEDKNDIDFYNATDKYLNTISDLESSIFPFLQTIKDSIKNNEEDLSIEVKEKALKINSATKDWEYSESEFLEKNGITQSTVDSITERIRN